VATYVLIPGAGSDSWYWHRVTPELEARGHDVVAVDLPCGDDTAGLAEYTDVVVDAIGDRRDLVLVAQSMGGFTAPLVCERVPVRLLVLVAAMVPAPGESGGEWWINTGHDAARRDAAAASDGQWSANDDDPATTFLNGVPDAVAAAIPDHMSEQSSAPFATAWPLDAWPDVPTRFLACRDDRFFPLPFLQRVVRDRLGIEPDVMPGGHLPALAEPIELVERLEAYRTALTV